MYFHYNVKKIVECTISSEQNVSRTLISLARLRRVKYGRFWLLSGRREIGAEIRELPENTGDLATLLEGARSWVRSGEGLPFHKEGVWEGRPQKFFFIFQMEMVHLYALST